MNVYSCIVRRGVLGTWVWEFALPTEHNVYTHDCFSQVFRSIFFWGCVNDGGSGAIHVYIDYV